MNLLATANEPSAIAIPARPCTKVQKSNLPNTINGTINIFKAAANSIIPAPILTMSVLGDASINDMNPANVASMIPIVTKL